MDLSKLSDDDLRAVADGDLARVSTQGLMFLSGDYGKGSASTIKNVLMGAARGAKDVIDTGAHALSSAAEKIAPETFKGESARVRAMNESGKREFDADYGNSTGASVGRVGGQIVTAAPLITAAGAGLGAAGLTRLGQSVATMGARGGPLPVRLAGGAVAGGLQSAAVDPGDAGMGAAIGAIAPPIVSVAGKVARATGAGLRPFTERGRERVVSDLLRKAATDEAAVSGRLANPPRSVAPLTFLEVADDPGISALHRMLENRSADYSGSFAANEARQNAARFDTLHSMSSGQNSPQALAAMREAQTGPLFDSIAKQYGDTPLGTMGVRSAMKDIAGTARYRTDAVKGEVDRVAKIFGSERDGWSRQLPYTDMHGARQNIDQRLYGGHGLDAKSSAQAAKGELSLIRERMTNALEKVPGFKEASAKYAEMSRPVDAAETLHDLLKAASTGSRDMLNNPVLSGAQLDRALKGLDAEQWAKLSDAQRDSVAVLAQELTRAARVKVLGKATGSNTAQNMMAGDSMPLSMIERLVLGATPTGLKSATGGLLNAVTAGAGDKVKARLAAAMLDPANAAGLLTPPAPMLSPQLRGLLATNVNRLAIGAPASLLGSP